MIGVNVALGPYFIDLFVLVLLPKVLNEVGDLGGCSNLFETKVGVIL